MKRCVVCERTKPDSAFNWSDKAKGYRHGKCRECKSRDRVYDIRRDLTRRRWDDDWIGVCHRCPLEDCVTGSAEAAEVCPAEIALSRGWTPDEAAGDRADELGLIEPVSWIPL